MAVMEWEGRAVIPDLDAVLPNPHHREHHSRVIEASAPAVWRAIRSVSLSDTSFGPLLTTTRALPARLAGRTSALPTVGPIIDHLPIPILILESDIGLVAAGVGQPWRPFGGEPPPALGMAEFSAFDRPGWVKMVMDFRLEPSGTATRLTTETRVRATDRRSERAFGAYWLVIRAGSGLLRRDLLAAVARRAERS